MADILTENLVAISSLEIQGVGQEVKQLDMRKIKIKINNLL